MKTIESKILAMPFEVQSSSKSFKQLQELFPYNTVDATEELLEALMKAPKSQRVAKLNEWLSK